MITILLITALFLLINGIPFIRIWLGRWPWEGYSATRPADALPKSWSIQFLQSSALFCNFTPFFLLEGSERQIPSTRTKTPEWLRQSPPLTTQKQNERTNQMKTTTNLKSPSRRHLPSLALLLATVTLLAFVPPSALAGDEIPFHANFITQFESVVEFPFLHVTVNGRGQATHMGMTTAFTDDQLVSLIDGSGTATYTLTAANGDTLGLALVVPIEGTINVEGGVLFSGSYTITGGTGRFNGATGSGVFGGSALFLTETDGIGAFAVVGTISSPGRLK